MDFKRIMIIAPHTDDGEFGMGGSIAKFIEMNKEVFYVAFSSAEKSVPKGFPKDTLKVEVQKATAKLGIKPDNLILFDFPVREFPKYRQDILERMIKLKFEIKPDVVFLPSPNDTHQDHKTIAEEGFRAYKTITILGYELPWNNLTFNTNAFIILSDKHIEKKILALKEYQSQRARIYWSPEFIRSWAITRGTQVGVKFAEVFEVIRWIMK